MKPEYGTWNTLAATFGIIRRGASTGYPAASCLLMLILTFTVVLPRLEEAVGGLGHSAWPWILLLLYAYAAYGLLYLVTAFWNIAMIASISGRLDGRPLRLPAGLRHAYRLKWQIFGLSAVSAAKGLVSLVIGLRTDAVFSAFIAPGIGRRIWTQRHAVLHSVSLAMAVPVIALEERRLDCALRRAETLVRRAWGEKAHAARSLGTRAKLASLALTSLVASPLLHSGLSRHDTGMVRLGLLMTLLASCAWIQVNALVDSMVALGAYRYAASGKSDLVPGDSSFGAHAFVR